MGEESSFAERRLSRGSPLIERPVGSIVYLTLSRQVRLQRVGHRSFHAPCYYGRFVNSCHRRERVLQRPSRCVEGYRRAPVHVPAGSHRSL